MDDQSLDHSAGDLKAQYRRLKKESAEQDERISQLYEKKLKQEKQLAEQDERLARLRSNSEFQDDEIKRQAEEIKLLKQELEEKDAEIKRQAAEIKRQAAEIKRQAAEIKRQAAEIKLLKQQLEEKEKKLLEQEEKLAQQGQKILELENEVGALRKIVNAMSEQFMLKDKHQKMVEEYEIELAGLTDHRNWQKSEEEQNLAHHLWDAEMEIKRLDYEMTEQKKKRDCHICLLHQTTHLIGTQHNQPEEFAETGSQTDPREFTDIGSQTDIKELNETGTQTNGQVIGHWPLQLGLLIIVSVVCCLLYNQFGPFRIALMLHYIRGPPPF